MIKENDFIGLPILNSNHEPCNFEVKNIIYCLNSLYIFGLTLQHTNLDKNISFIEYRKIEGITENGILILSLNDILNENQTITIKDMLKKCKSVMGYEIYSGSGDIVGIVKDVLIQKKSGKILGLIISEGLTEDLINGYSFLPLFKDIKFDECKVTLKRENILHILPQQGGLKKLFSIDLKN